MIVPRPYQRDAIAAAFRAWESGLRRPAEVMPTGVGKTVVLAEIAIERLRRDPGRRVLILVHTTELADQTVEKLHDAAPGLAVGRVQAQRNETLPSVIVASIATLGRNEQRRRMIRNVGLVIVDECHHAVAITYRTTLSHYGCLGELREDSADAIGFTATMVRSDEMALGDVWQQVVYLRTISDMINGYVDDEGVWDPAGYLVRPHGLHVEVDGLDLSKVKTDRGDYAKGAMGEALEQSLAPEAIAKAVAEHAVGRRIVAFAPTVRVAGLVQEALQGIGRSCGLVHGGLTAGDRKAVLGALRRRELDSVSNVGVLQEGFDEPPLDCAVLAAPTKSRGRYIQQVGRVLRPSPGKSDALVLDVVGNSRKHGLQAGIELFGVERAPREEALDDEMPLELAEALAVELDSEVGEGVDVEEIFGVDGPLTVTQIDLLAARSAETWHRTRAGVYFLMAGERYLAVVPGQGGRFDVVTISREDGRERWAAWIIQGVPDMAYAMATAAAHLTPGEKAQATRRAGGGRHGWRPASAAQVRHARRLGLSVHDGVKVGELHDAIEVAVASRRIDPYLPAYVVGGGARAGRPW